MTYPGVICPACQGKGGRHFAACELHYGGTRKAILVWQAEPGGAPLATDPMRYSVALWMRDNLRSNRFAKALYIIREKRP